LRFKNGITSKNNFALILIMKILTHNAHSAMRIVPLRPISLCSIGVSPVEFVNLWYLGLTDKGIADMQSSFLVVC